MVNIAIIGQSNGGELLYGTGDAPTKTDLVRVLVGERSNDGPPAPITWTLNTWEPSNSYGLSAIADTIHATYSQPVDFIHNTKGGSTISDWNTGLKPSEVYGQTLALIQRNVEKCDYIVFVHGEADASLGTTKANYKAGVMALYKRFIGELGYVPKFVITGMGEPVTVGGQAFATTANIQLIQDAQIELCNEVTGMIYAGDMSDIPTQDGVHFTRDAAGSGIVGERIGAAIVADIALSLELSEFSVSPYIDSGSNVTLSGSGTKESPLIISSTGGGGSGGRELLTGNRTYYVRTNGSDSNDGLANTSGGAFLTVQKAIDIIKQTLDLASYTITVQIADGTYTNGAVADGPFIGAGTVIIQGNTGAMSNVILSGTSVNMVQAVNGAILKIQYVKLQTTTGYDCVRARDEGKVYFSNINFGACAGSHINAFNGGKIICNGNYTISGNCNTHAASVFDGFVDVGNATVTLSGTPDVGIFAYASDSSYLHADSVTYSGSATGQRYNISSNSVINTNGGGANKFPGNSAGSTASGGQYL